MDFSIPKDYIGRRVDKFLRDNAHLTQANICEIARKKKLFVNSENVNYDYRLKQGDVVQVALSQEILDNKFQKKAFTEPQNTHKAQKLAIDLQKRIIFENDQLIAINKPHNLSVQGGKGVKISIDDCLPFLNQNPEEQLRIVHRIDSQTSGIIIFAKTLQAAQKITKLFAERKVKKSYHAVLVGEMKKAKDTIKTYISYTDESVMQDDKKFTNSQEAVTEYELLKTITVDGKIYSIVKFKPITGRKHQIRIHANWLKSYIVGDDRYSLKKQFNSHKKEDFDLQLFATSLQIDGVCNIKIEPEFDEVFLS